jgi:4-oxalmesaconate hydratase
LTVIDSHAHITAPAGVFSYQARLIASGGYPGTKPPVISEQAHRDAMANHLARIDADGTDLQLLSPRPFHSMHSFGPAKIVDAWTEFVNDQIAAQAALYPGRFRGVAGLPQFQDTSPARCLRELERAVTELGFVGALVDPDPLEGKGDVPGLGNEFWYPLYEKFVELDVPVYVHSAGCFKEREPYQVHFLNEETTATVHLLDSAVFDRFPTLKVVISHGGGAVPYHAGRFRSLRLNNGGEDFDVALRRLWYDTCLWSPEAFELLVKVVGPERILFGTETPGTGSGFDPKTGRHLDNMLPYVSTSPLLSEEDRTAILSENTRKLFKLDVPAEVPAGTGA